MTDDQDIALSKKYSEVCDLLAALESDAATGDNAARHRALSREADALFLTLCASDAPRARKADKADASC